MLKNTFLHIPGIGPTLERSIWGAGIRCWDDFLADRSCPGLPARVNCALGEHLEASAEALENRDAAYFEARLPGREHWRLYADFSSTVAFLDIETTGLGPGWDSITVIGLYDGMRARVFVRGIDLDQFPEEVARYSMLVTYNGRQFDLPFIRHMFGPLPAGQGHLDLRYPLRSLDYRGGLKGIEVQLGLDRGEELKGVDGYMAVLLWREYQRGNERALETLIRYNLEDVVNLRYLAEVAYNMSASRLPFPVAMLPVAPPHEIELPYEVDTALVRRLRGW